MDLDPTPTEWHNVAVNDDFGQTKAVCGKCGLLYDGTDRKKKMAAIYRHLADVFDPPQAVGFSE